MKRPINHSHYVYYDTLELIRKLGVVNMWGATPYLMAVHSMLNQKEATDILLTWIENYSELCDIRTW
jgi:hypothetical protein